MSENEQQELEDPAGDNPETQMNSAESSIGEIVDKAESLSQSLQEASAKLEEASRAVDAAEETLTSVQETASEVTGVVEEEESIEEDNQEEESEEEDSSETASDNPSPAATPVANAVAAAGEESGERPSYLTLTTPLGDGVLEILRIHGTEYISGLFHFTLEMRSTKTDVDFSQIVGEKVTIVVQMNDEAETKRYINGHVIRFVHGGSAVDYTFYVAEIVPWLWFLTLTKDSKIFQEKTVVEIITEVFDEMGYSDGYENSTAGTYLAREYCVQYQETAFEFVSRLMEEEGIFYFFKHEDGSHVLVLADDSSVHEDAAGLQKARYVKIRRSGKDKKSQTEDPYFLFSHGNEINKQ